MLFQRQGCSTSENSSNDVHVEIPTTSTNGQHQSSVTSQTITTVASINRSSDNEFTLVSASSREAIVDVTSLIKSNATSSSRTLEFVGNEGVRRETSNNVVNHFLHENLNCSMGSSNSSSSSSSRCTSETLNERNINCNKVSVSITDHNTDVNSCKNVNISKMKELNKALIPLTHSKPSSTTLTNGLRCETGVR